MMPQGDIAVLPAFSLAGRLVVVTGASQGLGLLFAQSCARAGAHVLLSSRREDKLREAAAGIIAAGGRADIRVSDITSVAQIKELADHAGMIADRDGLHLVAVNNAGIAFTKPAFEVNEEDFDRVIDVHLKGTFFACQQFGQLMATRGYGKIINLSSTWSAGSDTGKSIYCAAKAGISHLTSALAVEWAPLGVRVCALAPTTTLTEATQRSLDASPERAARLLARIPLGRYSVPEDLIGALVFLAGATSDFITGQTLFVDGGWTAR